MAAVSSKPVNAWVGHTGFSFEKPSPDLRGALPLRMRLGRVSAATACRFAAKVWESGSPGLAETLPEPGGTTLGADQRSLSGRHRTTGQAAFSVAAVIVFQVVTAFCWES